MNPVLRPAALFDFDGTLVDSMGIWTKVDIAYLKRFGHEFSADLQKDIEGMSTAEMCEYFRSRYRIPRTNEEMIRDWVEMSEEMYLHEVPLKPHVLEYLQYLKARGVRMAIATSTEPEIALPCLKARGIDSFFEAIATTTETGRGKPDPGVFQLAAKKLGVSPGICMAFDDLPAGIISAKAAGAYTIAVDDDFSKERRAEKIALADRFISDFSELIEYQKPLNSPCMNFKL